MEKGPPFRLVNMMEPSKKVPRTVIWGAKVFLPGINTNTSRYIICENICYQYQSHTNTNTSIGIGIGLYVAAVLVSVAVCIVSLVLIW